MGSEMCIRDSTNDNDMSVIQDRETSHGGERHGDTICDTESCRIKVLEVTTIRFHLGIVGMSCAGLYRQWSYMVGPSVHY